MNLTDPLPRLLLQIVLVIAVALGVILFMFIAGFDFSWQHVRHRAQCWSSWRWSRPA